MTSSSFLLSLPLLGSWGRWKGREIFNLGDDVLDFLLASSHADVRPMTMTMMMMIPFIVNLSPTHPIGNYLPRYLARYSTYGAVTSLPNVRLFSCPPIPSHPSWYSVHPTQPNPIQIQIQIQASPLLFFSFPSFPFLPFCPVRPSPVTSSRTEPNLSFPFFPYLPPPNATPSALRPSRVESSRVDGRTSSRRLESSRHVRAHAYTVTVAVTVTVTVTVIVSVSDNDRNFDVDFYVRSRYRCSVGTRALLSPCFLSVCLSFSLKSSPSPRLSPSLFLLSVVVGIGIGIVRCDMT